MNALEMVKDYLSANNWQPGGADTGENTMPLLFFITTFVIAFAFLLSRRVKRWMKRYQI
jgi:hypothetical protein